MLLFCCLCSRGAGSFYGGGSKRQVAGIKMTGNTLRLVAGAVIIYLAAIHTAIMTWAFRSEYLDRYMDHDDLLPYLVPVSDGLLFALIPGWGGLALWLVFRLVHRKTGSKL